MNKNIKTNDNGCKYGQSKPKVHKYRIKGINDFSDHSTSWTIVDSDSLLEQLFLI